MRLAHVPTAEHESQARADQTIRVQLDAEAERDELLWLMSDKRGRRFMHRLLTRSGLYLSSFTGDALSMAFQEGLKQEGRHQMNQITRHCLQRFIEMQQEARTNERRNDRSSTSSQPGA